MMVARVLKTIENFADTQIGVTGKQIIVKEMDLRIRHYKGVSFAVEDAVGASAGDLVLCSKSCASGRLAVVGIIDTVELVGTRVYDKKTNRIANVVSKKTMDKQ